MANIPTIPNVIGNEISTTLSSSVSNSDLSWTVASAAGMNTSGGFLIIDEGTSSEEVVYVQSISGNILTIADNGRGLSGTSATSHSSGATITDIIVSNMFTSINSAIQTEHNSDATHSKVGGNVSASNRFVMESLAYPSGLMLDGTISASASGGSITVSLQSIDSTGSATTPSSTNPIKIITSGQKVDITSALTLTSAANLNTSITEFTNKKVNLFVYLITRAGTATPIALLISRWPGALTVDDFNSTSSHEYGYIASASVTTGDLATVVGRFDATYNGGWGSVGNVIVGNIRYTDQLDMEPNRAVSGGTAPTYTDTNITRYQINFRTMNYFVSWNNAAGGTAGSGVNALTWSIPFRMPSFVTGSNSREALGTGYSYENGGTAGVATLRRTGTLLFLARDNSTLDGIQGNDQSSTDRSISVIGSWPCQYL